MAGWVVLKPFWSQVPFLNISSTQKGTIVRKRLKDMVLLATASMICTFSTACLAGEPTEKEQAAMDDILHSRRLGYL